MDVFVYGTYIPHQIHQWYVLDPIDGPPCPQDSQTGLGWNSHLPFVWVLRHVGFATSAP